MEANRGRVSACEGLLPCEGEKSKVPKLLKSHELLLQDVKVEGSNLVLLILVVRSYWYYFLTNLLNAVSMIAKQLFAENEPALRTYHALAYFLIQIDASMLPEYQDLRLHWLFSLNSNINMSTNQLRHICGLRS